jgi:hypothetical protein
MCVTQQEFRTRSSLIIFRYSTGTRSLLLPAVPAVLMSRPRLLELGSDLAPHLRLVRHPGTDEPVAGTRVRPFQTEQSGAIANSPRGIARTPGKA